MNIPKTNVQPFDNKIVLAVVNPHSGAGKAEGTFEKVIEPIWQRLGVPYEVLRTKYAGHCIREIANEKMLSRYKSIIAIGGDGTLAEIIEGLQSNRWIKNAAKILSLGIIPVGSGNGLSKNLFKIF